MAKKQIEESRSNRKRSKMEGQSEMQNNSNSKGKSKANNSWKERGNSNEDEPEVMVIPSSSSESQDRDNVVEQEEGFMEVDKDEDDEQGEEDDEAEEAAAAAEGKSSGITNQRSSNKADIKNNKEKKKSGLTCFPMNRINRIIKTEDSDIRTTQEAIFLINKASEKFLELFCKEAYACSFLERRSYIGYEHLSSVVCKRRRFDFLSDFVPEKMKAEAALAEMSSAET